MHLHGKFPANIPEVTVSATFPIAGILRCYRTTRTKPNHENRFLILASSSYESASVGIYFLMRNDTTETILIDHFHVLLNLPQEPELQSNRNIHFSITTE